MVTIMKGDAPQVVSDFYLHFWDWRQEQAYLERKRFEAQREREDKAERQQMEAETDAAWQKVWEDINKDAFRLNFSDIDIMIVWKLGLATWEASKKFNAKFPHE